MIKVNRMRAGQVRVTWVLSAEVHPGPVSVVGCFNGWKPGEHVLRRRSNGTLTTSLTVRSTKEIRFRYLGSDGHWFDDPDIPTRDGADALVVVDV